MAKIIPPIMPARIDRGRLQTDTIRRKINIPQPIKAETKAISRSKNDGSPLIIIRRYPA